MSTFTAENTPKVVEIPDLGHQHRATDGGMHIAIEHWKAGLDTGEMFADLPGGACSESHWGYLVKGRVTIRYNDGGVDVLEAGQAYYLRPGHNAHIDEDAEIVEFTRADDTPGINTVGN